MLPTGGTFTIIQIIPILTTGGDILIFTSQHIFWAGRAFLEIETLEYEQSHTQIHKFEKAKKENEHSKLTIEF